jgi:hypothetical protein
MEYLKAHFLPVMEIFIFLQVGGHRRLADLVDEF